MPLELVTVPCLSDNYAYILHDADSGDTAVADVPDAAPIEAALKNLGWSLSHILVTHHHNDHIGGVEALRAATGARVVGAAADASRLPRLDIAVSPGDTLAFGTDTLQILDVSGHTIGHIAYFFSNAHVLLSGDSLMALGCGRLFEGTPAQMHASLMRMAALPDDTKICSGHEYTQANARFALTVDPDNPDLKARAEKVDRLRKDGHPTVPSTLAEEKATNPFLRADDPDIRRRLGMETATNTEVFAEIRARKDRF
ncbi:hydroxyacylglutathione hydrolase [Fluviibacterium sp. DFM31]|uniref:Hydroxyacylglutathione hydrolase n=1 Tax=Meridianimarinicoccus marinus TaxID=3231483 RepID=A0ABV3L3P8_9RHOB